MSKFNNQFDKNFKSADGIKNIFSQNFKSADGIKNMFSQNFKNVVGSNPNILYQDANTGIYQDIDGTWYLKNGTPIDDFDPRTGAYEEGGSWYTFQGVELMDYHKETGSYQESDGTWYDSTGNEIPKGSNLLGMLSALGKKVDKNISVAAKKVSPNTIAAKPKTPTWVKPALIVVGVALVYFVGYKIIKK